MSKIQKYIKSLLSNCIIKPIVYFNADIMTISRGRVIQGIPPFVCTPSSLLYTHVPLSLNTYQILCGTKLENMRLLLPTFLQDPCLHWQVLLQPVVVWPPSHVSLLSASLLNEATCNRNNENKTSTLMRFIHPVVSDI